jgi:hypothetical protein
MANTVYTGCLFFGAFLCFVSQYTGKKQILFMRQKNKKLRRRRKNSLNFCDVVGNDVTYILQCYHSLTVNDIIASCQKVAYILYLFPACLAIRLYSISGLIKLCILNKCKQISTVLLLFLCQSCTF